jgi:hypothetical protein
LPGFLSGIILACLHWLGSDPSSSDCRNSASTWSLTTGQICFHTITGNPSSPGAFHDFAACSCLSTSSSVMVGIATGTLCGLRPSSSMWLGSGGKKVLSSSSACSPWSVVVVPSVLRSAGTVPNASLPVFRYLAAFQMLSLSARKLSQCFFFCCRMASWYCFAAPFAVSSRSGLAAPARLAALARFLQCV